MHTLSRDSHASFLSFFLATVFLMWCAAPLAAQERPPAQSTNTGVPEINNPPEIETAEDLYGHTHMHRHIVSAFLGGSRLKSLDGFAAGGEYEYRLHKLVGLGVQGEYISGDIRDAAVVFPVSFHPGAGLRLAAGPGFERAPEDREAPAANSETSIQFLFRFRIAYDFAVQERYIVSPSLSVDFVNGLQVWVYGVSFGLGF